MFDTMTLTKIAGSFCGALLVFLLGNFVAESLYHTGGGHGDDHAAGYVIETGAEEGDGGGEEGGVDFATLWAEADEGAGAKVFGKCKACHKLEDGANATGPHLYGVVGRAVGSEDFGYSGALVAVAQTWGIDELDAFLENPKGYAPGTKMSFSGLSKPEDRADLILYLDLTDGDRTDYAAPAAMTEGESAATEEAATEEAATEEAATEEAAAEEAATEEAAAEEATAEAASEEVGTEAAATEEATTEAATEEATTEAATEEATTEEAATEEAATEEVATEAAATEEAAAGGDAAMLASADLEAGEKIFRKCKACHKLEDGANGVGPHLYGVVGRDVGSVEGFRYSGNLVKVADVWSVENLDAFLEDPKGYAPGTKMSFAGIKKEEDRVNVIGYLDSIDD